MRTHKIKRLLWLLASGFWLLPSARAELTATVYPGYTLSANERPSTATLNLMARPTVTVSGTLGGTNVGLAAHTVSGLMLMSSVVDDNTVEFFDNGGSTAIRVRWSLVDSNTVEFFDNGGVRALRVKAYSIGTNVVNANLAGLGLGGGDGFALSNKTDNAAITITNDVITLMTNLSATYLNVPSNHVVVGTSTNRGTTVDLQTFSLMLATNQYQFVSSEIAVAGGAQAIDTAHSLGVTPTFVKCVLVCKTSQAGYAVGDEVDVAVASNQKFATMGANATNVFIAIRASADIELYNKVSPGSPVTTITPSSWRFKFYARP